MYVRMYVCVSLLTVACYQYSTSVSQRLFAMYEVISEMGCY